MDNYQLDESSLPYDFLSQIEERYNLRKLAKEQFDSNSNLSTGASKHKKNNLAVRSIQGIKGRLLDEGFVITADGGKRLCIKRGVLKAFYDNLDSEKVFPINLGHMPYEHYPIPLGGWTKDNLTLWQSDDGRYHLDTDFVLNETLNIVKDLKQSPMLAISAEINGVLDMDASRKEGCPVYESIDIDAFAIVGEAGNVNSDGIELSNNGGKKLSFVEKLMAKYPKPEDKEPKKTEEAELAVKENEQLPQELADYDDTIIDLIVQMDKNFDRVSAKAEKLEQELVALKAEKETLSTKEQEAQATVTETNEKTKQLLALLSSLTSKHADIEHFKLENADSEELSADSEEIKGQVWGDVEEVIK